MSFIRSLVDIFNRKNFDHTRTDLSVYTYHPQFRVFLASVGIFFGDRKSLKRMIMPVYNILVIIMGLILEGTAMWHGLMTKDYDFLIESFSIFVVLGTTPPLYMSVLGNSESILEMVHNMNVNFIEICALGPRHRVPFMKTQLLIWKLCIVWVFFLILLLTSMHITPMFITMYQSLFLQEDERILRPFPIPIWLPNIDYFDTPYYEYILCAIVVVTSASIQTYVVYISVIIHVLLHYHGLMDMIILDFEVIFEGLDESVVRLPVRDPRRIHAQTTLNSRMKRIVTWHNSTLKVIDTVSLMFGPPLVYQVVCSPIAICVICYKIASKLDQGQLDMVFILLLCAALIQIWIPCHLGTVIRDKAFAVGDACWNSGWEKTSLGMMLRSDIVIFILRCQKAVTIKFVGLPNVDLETYSSIVTKAYSYFNLLRQYTQKEQKG